MDDNLRKDSAELLVALRRVRVGYTSFLTKSLAEFGLNIPQYTALAVLGEKGEVTMSVLSEGLGITMGAVTNIVDRLIDAGMAVRGRGTDDRRVVRVKLSDKGRETLEKAVDRGVEFMGRYLQQFPADERKAFVDVYGKLAGAVMADFASGRGGA